MIRALAFAVLAASLCACAGTPRAPAPATAAAASPAPSPAPSPSATPAERPLPKPHKKLPHRPGAIARALAGETEALRSDLDEWIDAGRPHGRADLRPLKLRGLYQQRLIRYLTKHAKAAKRVVARLGRPLRSFVKPTVAVGAALRAMVTPVKPPVRFKTHKPAPSGRLLGFYKIVKRRKGIDWHVMASLNLVESKFGRVLGPSSAGARGPMQFLPSTWEKYGHGGDIDDPHDSILAAGRFLKAWGAPDDIRRALYAYNHSDVYVRAVLTYARMMRRDVLNYYDYYFWQVFVITTEGDKQLTGPGTHR